MDKSPIIGLRRSGPQPLWWLLLLLVASLVALGIGIGQRSDSPNAALFTDIAGRQRLLSQQILLAADELLQDGQPEYRARLVELMGEFDHNLSVIRDGGMIQGRRLPQLPASMHPKLEAVATQWRSFRALVDSITTPEADPAKQFQALSQLRQGAMELLMGSDALVKEYLAYAETGTRRDLRGLLLLFGLNAAAAALASLYTLRHLRQRKILEQHLREQHRFVESILDVAGALVVVLDRQGGIQRFNKSSEIASGYTFAETRGRKPWDFLLPEGDKERVAATFADLLRGEYPSVSEHDWLTKSGRRLRVSWTITVLEDEAGAPAYVICAGLDITARRAAEAALRNSEERFRNLFETMSQGVVYQDVTGRIIDANPAAEHILGISLDQMIGLSSRDSRWHCIHEDGRPWPGDDHPAMRVLREGREIRDAVMGVFHPGENTYRWLIVSAIPQFRGEESKPYVVFTAFTDITEREAAREALERSESRFRALVETTNDLIWEVDGQGRYVYASPQVERILGYHAEELLGRPLFDHMPADEAQRVGALYWGFVKRGCGFNMLENGNLHRDGRLITLESSAQPILDRGDHAVGYRGVSRDISERKEAESELRRHTEELERLHARMAEEQNLAAEIMDYMARRHALDDPAIQYWTRPTSAFSGDALAMTRSASGKLYLMLADATGHGLPAAVCLLPALAVFYGMSKRDMPLGEIIEEINRQLRASLPASHFLAASLMLFDNEQPRVQWWIGGMPPILVLDEQGEVRARLEQHQFALGIADFDAAMAQPNVHDCAADEEFVLYTDGLLEAMDPWGKEFGADRLYGVLANAAPETRLEAARRALDAHLDGGSAHDDVTMVSVRCPLACEHCIGPLPMDGLQASLRKVDRTKPARGN